ncbi:hypothetical protein JXB02_04350 [Candidatus Woesearchaeota archaeon]|nr:hypothetical protein [Candidatus Woesearchaeota archaeon]
MRNRHTKRGELGYRSLIALYLVINVMAVPLIFAAPEDNPESMEIERDIQETQHGFSSIVTLEDAAGVLDGESPIGFSDGLLPLVLLTLIMSLGAVSFIFKGTKGQVTVFIIIGIILLFSTALIFYIRSRITEETLASEIIVTEKIPIQLQPIKEYVEDCVEIEAKEALKRLGEQGGYIDTSSLYLDPFSPTESEGVEFFPGTGYIIPYWHYMTDDDSCFSNCAFSGAEAIPPLCKPTSGCIYDGPDSFEVKAEAYIEENLIQCLNGFQSFEEQGYTFQIEGDPEVNMNIKERAIDQEMSTVSVYMKFPVKVTRGDASTRVTEYYTTFESGIYDLYVMAIDLVQSEREECTFEEYITNALSFYQGFDAHQLPPYAEERIGESVDTTWFLDQVKGDIKPITMRAIRQMGFYGALNFAWPEVEADQYEDMRQAIQDQHVVFPFDVFYDADIHAEYFDWWEPYLQINPNEGGMIKPDSQRYNGPGILAVLYQGLSTTYYNFMYQYSFPVVIQLKKRLTDDSIYTMRYAIEVNIRNNQCLTRGSELTLEAPITTTFICDEDVMGLGDEMAIKVTDKQTGQPLDNVSVMYYVGPSCYLGVTDGNGSLETHVPDAFGGFISLSKDGYLEKRIHSFDFSSTLQVELLPFVDVNITYKTIDPTLLEQMQTVPSLQQGYALRAQQGGTLYSNDSVITSIRRVPADYSEGEHQLVTTYNNGTNIPSSIELVPGRYQVEALLFKKEYNITIPEEQDIVCVDHTGDGVSCEKRPVDPNCGPDRGSSDSAWKASDCAYTGGYECWCDTPWWWVASTPSVSECCDAHDEIVYEEMPLTTFPNGGAVLSNDTTYFIIPSYSSLSSSNEIVIYLFREDVPTRHFHLEDFNAFEEKSSQHVWMIEPEIR